MNLLKPIVSEIQNILSKNSIDELVDIRISNLDNYDYQINNLVKYQNHPNIEAIKDATSKLLDSSTLVDSFEYANNLFINIEISAESLISNLENIEDNIQIDHKESII
jgi:arginyl-tRNA synthetase